MNSIRRLFPLGCLLGVIFTLHQEASAYDRLKAVAHAQLFWSKDVTGYNPAYNDYSSTDWEAILGFLLPGIEARYGDCANFASQNLIAGGLTLAQGPGLDDKGAIPIVSNLATNLGTSQRVKIVAQIDYRTTQTAPSWLVPGDIITWGDDSRAFRHSGTVVEGTGNSSLVSYHSNDRKNVAWDFPASQDDNKWLINFYHIDSAKPNIRLKKQDGTPIENFLSEDKLIVEAEDDPDGSGIKTINIKHVQPGGGVASHVNSTRTFTGNNLLLQPPFFSLRKN